jgi:alcohol dehydrogenase (NADP+)
MPYLGFGTYKLDNAEAVKAALAAGYRHIDCAAGYQNQAIVGQGLSDFLAQEGGRQKLWITTKVWNTEHRPERVR